MLQYVSRDVRKQLLLDGKSTLSKVKSIKKDKFQSTLEFMKQWSADLLARQEEIWNNQNIINQKLSQYENNLKNLNSNRNNKQNNRSLSSKTKEQKPFINIQKIIQEELISKVQEVYMRQMMMFQSQKKHPDYMSNKTIAFSKNSTIKKVQDQQMNLSNYFNNFECLSQESYQKQSTQNNNNQGHFHDFNDRQKYLNLKQQQIQENSQSYQTDSQFNQLYLQNKKVNLNKETRKMILLSNPKHLQTFQQDFIQQQQQQLF